MKRILKVILILLPLATSLVRADEKYDYLYPTTLFTANDVMSTLEKTDEINARKNPEVEKILALKISAKEDYLEKKQSCYQQLQCIKNLRTDLKSKLKNLHQRLGKAVETSENKKSILKKYLVAAIISNIMYEINKDLMRKEKNGKIILETDIFMSRGESKSQLAQQLDLTNILVKDDEYAKTVFYVEFFYQTEKIEKNVVVLSSTASSRISYSNLASIIRKNKPTFNINLKAFLKAIYSENSSSFENVGGMGSIGFVVFGDSIIFNQ